MKRETKAQIVEELKDKLSASKATFLTGYRGIEANDIAGLRSELRGASIEFKVVRNTLAKRALEGTDAAALTEHMVGPKALVFTYSDGAQAAKTLTGFAKEHPALEIEMCVLGTSVIGLDEIKALADLPSKEELVAKMLGSMNAPVQGIAGVLAAVPRKLVYALNAIKDSKEQAA